MMESLNQPRDPEVADGGVKQLQHVLGLCTIAFMLSQSFSVQAISLSDTIQGLNPNLPHSDEQMDSTSNESKFGKPSQISIKLGQIAANQSFSGVDQTACYKTFLKNIEDAGLNQILGDNLMRLIPEDNYLHPNRETILNVGQSPGDLGRFLALNPEHAQKFGIKIIGYTGANKDNIEGLTKIDLAIDESKLPEGAVMFASDGQGTSAINTNTNVKYGDVATWADGAWRNGNGAYGTNSFDNTTVGYVFVFEDLNGNPKADYLSFVQEQVDNLIKEESAIVLSALDKELSSRVEERFVGLYDSNTGQLCSNAGTDV